MKTISTNRSLNENFKRVQLLPVWDSEAMTRFRTRGSWSAVQAAAQPMAVAGQVRDLNSPRAVHRDIEWTLPSMLALSTLAILAQTLGVTTDWSTNWLALAAWVAGLAG